MMTESYRAALRIAEGRFSCYAIMTEIDKDGETQHMKERVTDESMLCILIYMYIALSASTLSASRG